jgi:DNA-binding protein YbaB
MIEQVKQMQGQMEKMHDELEKFGAHFSVALARQCLVAAAFWLSKYDEMTPKEIA